MGTPQGKSFRSISTAGGHRNTTSPLSRSAPWPSCQRTNWWSPTSQDNWRSWTRRQKRAATSAIRCDGCPARVEEFVAATTELPDDADLDASLIRHDGQRT